MLGLPTPLASDASRDSEQSASALTAVVIPAAVIPVEVREGENTAMLLTLPRSGVYPNHNFTADTAISLIFFSFLPLTDN